MRFVLKLFYLSFPAIMLVNADVRQFSLQIEPAHAHLKPGEDLIVTCKAPVPLTHCQLKVTGYSPYDASMGHQSAPRGGFSYQGRGLQQGDCGFHIQGDVVFNNNSTWPVTCRVRSIYSDWTYAIMAVHKNTEGHVGFSVDQRVHVVAPGSELDVVYKVESSFSTCKILVESWGLSSQHDLISGGCSSNRTLCALGDTLNRRECGYSIKNVTDEFNGLIWIDILGDKGQELQSDFLMIFVARVPSQPILTMDLTTGADGYQKLTAECVVTSRPQANISWFLGDETVDASEVSYVPLDKWGKLTSLRTTRQRMVRYLDYTEEGKDLWCRAEHFLLPGGRPSNRIRIQGSHMPEHSCVPLESDSVLITCHLGTAKKDCKRPQRVGTIARLQCRPGYSLPNNIYYREIYCSESGKWNRDVFSCFPDCGRRKTNAGQELISNGIAATVGEFPWHVAIHRNQGGTFQQVCGGSLISTSVVLTAAHCFWNDSLDVAHSASEFRVAAGTYKRAWEDDDRRVQRKEISRIDTNLYGGRQRNFAYDIALVFLKSPVRITDAVNIICVDWDSLVELAHLQAGNIGVVPGWGFTEEGTQSNTLLYIDLPYVPQDICYAALPATLKPNLTNDKFCAGYQNQSTSVCPGDSGGGLIFLEKKTKQYYLRGVVSINFKPAGLAPTNCYAEQYTAFTRVSTEYIRWIQRNI